MMTEQREKLKKLCTTDNLNNLKKAHAEGKTIQWRGILKEWKDATTPAWDLDTEYRIKPEAGG